MEMGVIFFIVAVLIVAVWVLFKLKAVQHKFITFLLIVLILFSFFSFYLAFNGKDISIKKISDLEKVTNLYFSWLGNVFNNMKFITTQAVKMNWEGNKTAD
ncbi:MAG: hypothetical protein M1416_01115 [Candidatus Pacearchaeota archaeon]|nr:hypothetical protein [Candidatus Pacearchaeota archaeon]